MTLILRPVSCASCSRMCLVGLGVAAKADLRTSNCLALMVVRGPRLLAPTPDPPVFSLDPSPLTDSESASSKSLTPSSPSLLLLLVDVLFLLLFERDRLLFCSCLTSGDSMSMPGRPTVFMLGVGILAPPGPKAALVSLLLVLLAASAWVWLWWSRPFWLTGVADLESLESSPSMLRSLSETPSSIFSSTAVSRTSSPSSWSETKEK